MFKPLPNKVTVVSLKIFESALARMSKMLVPSPDEQRVLDELDIEGLLAFTREVVRIPSFPPEEGTVAKTFVIKMQELGLDTESKDMEAGRPYAIGRLRGSGKGPSLVFNGHLDTSPMVSGWVKDPFGGDLEEGEIFGHGVSNMKASDAAYVYALSALLESGARLNGTVTITLVPGETTGGQGTIRLLDQGLTAEGAIIGEPTRMKIVTMHAGVAQVKVSVTGRTGHYAGDIGVNAIEKMYQFLQNLGHSHEEVPSNGWMRFRSRQDYAGLPRFNVGYISGGLTRECLGTAVYNTPDFCTAAIDFRFVPGQSLDGIIEDMTKIAERMTKGQSFRIDIQPYRDVVMKPMETALNAPVVEALAGASRRVLGKETEVGGIHPFKFMGSDGGHLQSKGIPTALFGPGEYTISVADESVRVENLISAAKIYALTALRFCNP